MNTKIKTLFNKILFFSNFFGSVGQSLKAASQLYKFRKHEPEFDPENRSIIYPVKYRGKNFDLALRTLNGDFDILFEVFHREVYHIPEEFGVINPQVIVDLGANIGLSAIYFHTKYPTAKIFCLEMENSNYQLLLNNIKQFDLLEGALGAIYDKNTAIDISKPTYSYNFRINENQTSVAGTTHTTTMFQLMEHFEINHIDLLKIDIEGAESSILARNNMWLEKVERIIIELHDPYTLTNLMNDLKPFNFTVFAPNNSNKLKMIYAIKKNG